MKIKNFEIYFLMLIFFGIDILYFYGYANLIDIFIENALIWFTIPFIGFLLSYFFNKADVKHKVIMNIVITLGVLLNAYLIFTWYILKDFGF